MLTRRLSAGLLGFLLGLTSLASAQGSTVGVVTPFPDVSPVSEFLEGITYLRDHAIVRGYPDGTFRPLSDINRAEFVRIIVGSLAKQQDIDSCFFRDPVLFSDTLPYEWYGKYLCVAKERGIIGGYPDGSFRPAQFINVAEAAKILFWSFGLTDARDNRSAPEDPWFKRYLAALADKHALPTTLSQVDQPIRRGEVAEMIYRLGEHIGTKPSLLYADLAPKEASSASASSSARYVLPIVVSSPSSAVTSTFSQEQSIAPLSLPSSIASSAHSSAASIADLSGLVLLISEECSRQVRELDTASYRWFTDLDPAVLEQRVVLLRFQKLCFRPLLRSADPAFSEATEQASGDACPYLTRFLESRQADPRVHSQNWIQMRYWSEVAQLAENEWYLHGCAGAGGTQSISELRSLALARLYGVIDRPSDAGFGSALEELQRRF